MATIKINNVEFLKGCASGMTLKEFKGTYGHYAKMNIDFEKAYVILGGKPIKAPKKNSIKNK